MPAIPCCSLEWICGIYIDENGSDGVCQCLLLLGASREACAERHRRKKGRKPLFRSLRLVWRLFVVFGFAIKKADGIGDALDNGLLDGDFDCNGSHCSPPFESR